MIPSSMVERFMVVPSRGVACLEAVFFVHGVRQTVIPFDVRGHMQESAPTLQILARATRYVRLRAERMRSCMRGARHGRLETSQGAW
jgi:hypothetical protein